MIYYPTVIQCLYKSHQFVLFPLSVINTLYNVNYIALKNFNYACLRPWMKSKKIKPQCSSTHTNVGFG